MITNGKFRYIIFTIAVFITSCSHGNYREERILLRDLVKNGKFTEAKSLVVQDDFIDEKESVLLNNIEKGTIFYLSGNYYQALQYFEQSYKLSQELYTELLSKSLASMTDANNDMYYGSSYELSMLRFYLSLTHYNLYKIGKYEEFIEKNVASGSLSSNNEIIVKEKILNEEEKKRHLVAAKSIILEWDSFLSGRKILEDDRTYIDDLLLKIWGAFIHEEIGSKNDIQIAKNLYKSAKNFLNTKAGIMPCYNKKSDEFVKNLNKIKTLSDEERQQLIEKTELSKELENFIDKQILRLEEGKKENFTLILKEDFVTLKQAERKSTSIISDDNIALQAFTLFGTSGVNFEVPTIYQQQMDDSFQIILEKNKKIITIPIVLVEPLSDIAFRNIEEKIPKLITKEQNRLSLKYTVAALTAYATYVSVSQIAGEELALYSAIVMFKGLEEQISEKSKVDLRQWTSLADNIRIAKDNIPEGKYNMKIIRTELKNQSKRQVFEKEIEITNGGFFLDLQL